MNLSSDRALSNDVMVSLFVHFRHWLGVRDALVATRWCHWTACQWEPGWH